MRTIITEIITEIAKKLDWSKNVTNTEIWFYTKSQAGRDFEFSISTDGLETIEDLKDKIYSYYESYDISEETYLCLNSFGRGIREIYAYADEELEYILTDIKWCKNAILELHDVLDEIDLEDYEEIA